MPKRFSLNLLVLFYILDILLTGGVLRLAGIARHRLPFGEPFPVRETQLPLSAYLMVAIIWSLCFFLLSVYDANRVIHAVDEFQRVTAAIALATFVFAGAIYLAHYRVPRLLFLYFFAGDLTVLLGYRAIVRIVHRLRNRVRPRYTTRVLIVGAGTLGRDVAQALGEYGWAGLHVAGFLDDDPQKQGCQVAGFPVLAGIDRACDIVQSHQIEDVIIALPMKAHTRLANLVAELWKLPVRIKVVPDYSALVFTRATFESLGDVPLIGLREPAIDDFHRFIKRLFDLILGVVLLILLSPLLALIALLIRLDSEGPVIFKQQRIGENGRLFGMYKFRSMVPDADERLEEIVQTTPDGAIVHKIKDDPRVTRVGRMLRQFSLDELPQLFNVLKGDMSLVGPRPELPWLVEKYEPWQRQRFSVPQGITGWWQVNGRSDKPMHLHTEEDLYYIQNYSLWLDLQILWRTVGAVLKRRGAF
jgi:exopolysaccharide biosynthesis polyprenyl glycosylphosphotransferase